MVGKNNDYMHMQKTSKKVFRFSLRKLSVGTVSVVASSLFFGSGSVSASDVAVSLNAENVVVSENSQTEKQETKVIEQNTEAVVAPAVTKIDTVGVSESVEKPVVVETPEKELVIDKTQEAPVVLDKAPAEGAGFRNTTPASHDVLLNNAKFLQPESDANTLAQVLQNLPAQLDVKKVTDVLPMVGDKVVGDVTLHDAAVNKVLVKYADDTTQVIMERLIVLKTLRKKCMRHVRLSWIN